MSLSPAPLSLSLRVMVGKERRGEVEEAERPVPSSTRTTEGTAFWAMQISKCGRSFACVGGIRFSRFPASFFPSDSGHLRHRLYRRKKGLRSGTSHSIAHQGPQQKA